MYIKRTIEKCLKEASNYYPVILLAGARDVGKTNLLLNCKEKNRNYVSLENITNRSLAKDDPELFLQKFSCPLFIDEIQYAPKLLDHIKKIIKRKKKRGMFWLAGSQQFFSEKILQSFDDKVRVLNLSGFSQREKFEIKKEGGFIPSKNFHKDKDKNKAKAKAKIPFISIDKLFKMIWQGSYPEMTISKEKSWEDFYSSYLQVYIERDILNIIQVSDKMLFLKFLRSLAARTSKVLNYSTIAREIGVSSPTIKSWVLILELSGIIFILPAYHKTLSSRMIKASKIFFLDTGLAAYLTNWQTPETLEAGAMSEAFFETYIISEIVKSYWHSGKTPPLTFFQDKGQKKIELLIKNKNKIHPVSIKKKSSPTQADTKDFCVFEKKGIKRGIGAVIALNSTISKISYQDFAIPVGCV